MRRHEPTLDPAAAAELEALEAALSGDPAAEPELAAPTRRRWRRTSGRAWTGASSAASSARYPVGGSRRCDR